MCSFKKHQQQTAEFILWYSISGLRSLSTFEPSGFALWQPHSAPVNHATLIPLTAETLKLITVTYIALLSTAPVMQDYLLIPSSVLHLGRINKHTLQLQQQHLYTIRKFSRVQINLCRHPPSVCTLFNWSTQHQMAHLHGKLCVYLRLRGRVGNYWGRFSSDPHWWHSCRRGSLCSGCHCLFPSSTPNSETCWVSPPPSVSPARL